MDGFRSAKLVAKRFNVTPTHSVVTTTNSHSPGLGPSPGTDDQGIDVMTGKPSPQLLIERTDGVVRVLFKVSSIDETNFIDLANQLEPTLRPSTPQTVILDFHGVRHVDEIGIMLVQSIQESIKEVGGTILIRGCNIEQIRPAKRIHPIRDLDHRQPLARPRFSTSW